MDRNSIIGLTLIGALLVGYTFMSQPSEAERKQQAKKEQQAKLKEKEKEKAKEGKTKKIATSNKEKTSDKKEKDSTVVKSESFKPEFLSLKSDKMEVVLSTEGGNVSSVKLNDFLTYRDKFPSDSMKKKKKDVSGMYLFKEGDNKNQLRFTINGKKYSTGNKEFKIASKSDKKVVLRHELIDGSIDFIYAIKGDYDLDYTIQVKDLNGKVLPSSVLMDWKMNMRQTERLLSEQRKVSTICFQNADEKLDWNSEVANDWATAEQNVNWVAYKQSYFSSILQPKDAFEKKGTKFSTTNFEVGDKEYFTHIRKFSSTLNLGLESAKDGKASFNWYFGPNEFKKLASYDKGYDDILNLGWGIFRWINLYAVQPLFTWLIGTGIPAGLAILLLTLILKLILMPIQWKMFVSSAKMRILKPQIDELNAKYPNKEDAMKKQMDMMALYRESGASPLAGCVPMLFQMPILLAVFRFFPTSFDMRQKGFLWAEDLSSFDSILDFGTWIPLYGNHISLFTLLMAATTLVYTHLNSGQMQQQQQPGMPNMKVIMYFFPIMMIFFFNNYASGLSYYYFISTLMTIVLMWVIKKFFVDEEKLKLKMAESRSNSSKKASGTPKKKSKFMTRLEEIQKQQQEQLKNKKK